MLPAYIIEELRRREQARREQESRPQPRLELPVPDNRVERLTPVPSDPDRGIAIIELF